MFRRELMITGLKKQQAFLADLVDKISTHTPLSDEQECRVYDNVTRQVERNLKRLRRIHWNHFESMATS